MKLRGQHSNYNIGTERNEPGVVKVWLDEREHLVKISMGTCTGALDGEQGWRLVAQLEAALEGLVPKIREGKVYHPKSGKF